MTAQITIIGLGQIGGSVGLSLAAHKKTFFRVGHDIQLANAHKARSLGAIDRVDINVPHSVSNADLVLIALPADQIREMFELIAPDLKEGAIVMETGPSKVAAASWAEQYLPRDRYYVGLCPVVNPLYLKDASSGLEAAHADLFTKSPMVIVAPTGVRAEALDAVVGLVEMLGATPIFADINEIDGLMAAVYLVPQLLATILAKTLIGQPGWVEAGKLAGQQFFQMTTAAYQYNSAAALVAACLQNNENTRRLLGDVLIELAELLKDLEGEDGSILEKKMDKVHLDLEKWWKHRREGQWTSGFPEGAQLPTTGDVFGSLLTFNRKTKNPKNK